MKETNQPTPKWREELFSDDYEVRREDSALSDLVTFHENDLANFIEKLLQDVIEEIPDGGSIFVTDLDTKLKQAKFFDLEPLKQQLRDKYGIERGQQ